MGVKLHGKKWRYRKLVTLPDGTKQRIKGTPEINTKVAAEEAERSHIERLTKPEQAQARAQLARQLEQDEKQREDGGAPTFKTFAPPVIAAHRPKKKRAGKPSSDRSRKTIANGPLMRFFAPYRMDQIDQPLINMAIKSKGWAGRADSTINNRLAVLSIVLRAYYRSLGKARPEFDLKVYSQEIDESDPDNEDEQCEAVEPADVNRLLAAADKYRDRLPYWIRAAVLLAADAGLRNGELRAVLHTDVIERAGREPSIMIRRALSPLDELGPPKNGKAREVPLSSRLFAELKKLQRIGVTLLARERPKYRGMALRYKPTLTEIKRLYKLAGVTMPKATKGSGVDRPWHGLRHTYGTQLAACGASDRRLMKLMGHCDIRTSMIYVNPNKASERAGDEAIIRAAFG